MKTGIHPTWYSDCQVTCSCGNSFTIGSINPTLQVDICSNCHPFYTGEMRFVDRQGRVDRFKKKLEAAQARGQQTQLKSKRKQQTSTQADPQSYRDILRDQQANLRKAKKAEAPAEAKAA